MLLDVNLDEMPRGSAHRSNISSFRRFVDSSIQFVLGKADSSIPYL